MKIKNVIIITGPGSVLEMDGEEMTNFTGNCVWASAQVMEDTVADLIQSSNALQQLRKNKVSSGNSDSREVGTAFITEMPA